MDVIGGGFRIFNPQPDFLELEEIYLSVAVKRNLTDNNIHFPP